MVKVAKLNGVKKRTKKRLTQQLRKENRNRSNIEEEEDDAMQATEYADVQNTTDIKSMKQKKKKKLSKAEKGDGDERSSDEKEEDSEGEQISGKQYKNNIEQLKKKDPEFYKFLQEQEADILDFEGDEEEGEQSGEEESDEGEELDDEEMEGNEEEEEEEDESEEGDSRIPKMRKEPGTGRLVVDDSLLDFLEENLEDDTTDGQVELSYVRLAVDVFTACTARVGADIEPPAYVINEQAIFDGCVRVCFRSIGPLLCKLMGAQDENDTSTVSKKRFKKYSPLAKQYLQSLLLFITEIQTERVILSTLHTINPLVNLFAKFTKLAKRLVKVLVRIWTRKTLNCRIMACLIMSKLASHPQHFSNLFKSCYLGFVSNSRDVNSDSLPLLQFMQRSFAEITLLAPERSYPYAFVYIRQIAIHLRNALIGKRSDLVQTVYNWQLIQCLYLWVRVISKAHYVNGAEALNELAYPLTQIIIGVANLCPSSRLLPLRLHCISLLIQLQANCAVYVPTLQMSCDVFDDVVRILAKKPNVKAMSKKKENSILPTEVNLETMLRCSTAQMEQLDWRNAVCDYLFRIFMQAFHISCSQAAFPDLVFPIVHRLQHSQRHLKSARFHQRVKTLLQKVNEHAKWVRNEINKRELRVNDDLQVLSIRSVLNHPDSPFRAYYRQWEKVWKLQLGQSPMTVNSCNDGERKQQQQQQQQKKKKLENGLKESKDGKEKKRVKEEKQHMNIEETIPNGKKSAFAQKEMIKMKKQRRQTETEGREGRAMKEKETEDVLRDMDDWSDDGDD